MDTKLIVSASPHLRSEETTTGLMANVIVALTPCVVASAIIFGLRALLVTAVSVVACVAFEWLYCKLLKKANPISDLSAVVTGIILAMNVPVGMPIGELLIGDFVAIIVVKQLFGGIGMNFANPALVGRIVLFVSFAGAMNNWVFPEMKYERVILIVLLAAVWGGFLDGPLSVMNNVVWDLLDNGTQYIDTIAYSAYYASVGAVI